MNAPQVSLPWTRREPWQAVVANPVVAVGPVTPGWGSWEWVGHDVCRALSRHYQTLEFGWEEIPDADVVLVVKHSLPVKFAREISRRAAVLYCPVDRYGSPAEIQADAAMLALCTRVIVHCQELLRWFAPFATVEYMDHHVKFVGQEMAEYHREGFVLWVGVRSNLPYLIQWACRQPLCWPLRVLTNLEFPNRVPTAAELGFPGNWPVEIEHWTPQRHLELLTQARAAVDIKGDDFRQRHKPPAKALDYIAGGLPLAINVDSSSAQHLARLGFEVAGPQDAARWFSRAYWQQTRCFGQALREVLSLEHVALRYRHLIDTVWRERLGQEESGAGSVPRPPACGPGQGVSFRTEPARV